MAYGEFSPRLNLSKITSTNLSFSFVKQLYLAFQYNSDISRYNAYLFGLGSDLNIYGFDVFGLNVYKKNQTIGEDTYQLSPYYKTKEIFGIFHINGFVDWTEYDFLTQNQFLFDMKKPLNIENSIDLEALANHRGSAFGRKITPQPSQINFENALAYNLIQKLDKGLKYLVFEDEGKHVGSLFIPKIFADYLLVAPLIILETSMVERVKITFNEYVLEAQKMYDNNLIEYKDEMLGAMNRIKKKLGVQRYREVCNIFGNAFDEQMQSGSLDAHKEWIEYLLREYYDPMYDYQIQKRSQQVEFRGSREEVVEYLASHIFIAP